MKDTTNMLIPTIADMHNVGKGGEASPTTAAQFLQRFVNDTPGHILI